MTNLPVERKAVDPNKWSLNQQTGEYHKVTFTSKDGRRLIEPKNISGPLCRAVEAA